MNTYEEALDWIHGLLKFGIKPGLKRVEWLLERVGNPEQKVKCLHVAGTNGKGSTVEYLRSIFNEAGYKAGTFTSPYLITFNERISIDGKPIEDIDLLRHAKKLRPLVDELAQTSLGSPTEFEVITVISLLYFAEKKPDIVIYEVGLGGLYDSTNVIMPELCLITNIGFDHMSILGETIEAIAFQKAGIIKSGIPVITTVEQPEAVGVIKKKAREVHSEAIVLNEEFTYKHVKSTDNGEEFVFMNQDSPEEKRYVVSMKGPHQVKNASLAVATIDYINKNSDFTFEIDEISEGLIKANWAGRFEKVSSRPDIILDGAHNIQGVLALKETLLKHYAKKNIYLLFAALHDKEYSVMMEELKDVIKEAYFTTFDFPRAASVEQLLRESPFENSYGIVSWKEAIESLEQRLTEDDILIITGSLYFISEIRKHFKKTE